MRFDTYADEFHQIVISPILQHCDFFFDGIVGADGIEAYLLDEHWEVATIKSSVSWLYSGVVY
jgi:hypothetical protein